MIFTDKNICPDCGTENEKEYLYCKNCGVKLGVSPDKATPPEPTVQHAQPHNTPPTPAVDSIDGIPTSEIEAFVGSKTGIINKFIKMEITRGKVSWNWPVAVLGFLLGPAGAALWFLYRKMYKIAALIIAAALIITVGGTVVGCLTMGTPEADIDMLMESYIAGGMGDEEYVWAMVEYILDMFTPAYIISLMIGNTLTLAAAIVLGIFADYIYKNHTVNRIKKYRAANVDPRYYQLGLASIGGTSGGMVALGVLAVIIISSISEAIATIFMQGVFL